MVPVLLFAVVGAFSGSYLTTNDSPNLIHIIIMRMPIALLWLYLDLACFDLAN